MKRLTILFTIFILCCPLFVFNTSAASYDLIGPNPLSYQITAGRDESFKYFGSYWYEYTEDEEGYEVLDRLYGSRGFPGVSYTDKVNGVEWVVGSPWSAFYPYSKSVFSTKYNDQLMLTLQYGSGSSNLNSLKFGQFVYEGLMLPVTGTYLKVSLSFQGFLNNVPSELRNYLNTDYFCYLCDDRTAGSTDQYSVPRLYASSVVVTDLGGGYNRYDYYFNYQNIPDGTFLSDNICLAVRIPVYIPNDPSFNGNTCFYMSAELPQSYEILTIGGYDQELASIENAIITSNQNLIDLYTQQSDEDVSYIIQANDKIDSGKNTVNDYNNANDQINQIVTNAVVPDLDNIINDQIGNSDTINSEISTVFQNQFIVSALLIVFGFCLISVLLYGIKG